MSEQWLRCAIFNVMFSDELAISLLAKSGKVSYFVPKDQVMGSENEQGKVRVRVYREDNISWAVLPTENQAIVPVHDGDLLPL